MEIEMLRFFCLVFDIVASAQTSTRVREELARRGVTFKSDKSVVNKIAALETRLGGVTLFERDRTSGFTARTAKAHELYALAHPFLRRFCAFAAAQLPASRPTIVLDVDPVLLEFLVAPALEPVITAWRERADIRVRELSPDLQERFRTGQTHLAVAWEDGLPLTGAHMTDWGLAPPCPVFAVMRRTRTDEKEGPRLETKDLERRELHCLCFSPLADRLRETVEGGTVQEWSSATAILAHVRQTEAIGIFPYLHALRAEVQGWADIRIHPLYLSPAPTMRPTLYVCDRTIMTPDGEGDTDVIAGIRRSLLHHVQQTPA
jgi:hypothetical protein